MSIKLAATFLAVIAIASSSLAQNVPKPESGSYNEQFRPQVHFSPQEHWTNDPNGLVYFDGEYHLFYQFNPFGDVWGHMSWGHAVSTDLLHWKELPVAIPEIPGEMVFTGSIVVDAKNTSGLCTGGKACLVAVYTGYHPGDKPLQVQDLAVSQDRGRTWQRYAGNPVLDLHMADFRDPSVSWSDEDKAWLMAVSLPNEHQVAFYTSPDLKQWTRQGLFGPAGTVAGQWECPDLLRIPSADGKKSIWALKVGLNPGSLQGGSGEQYFLGSFDGKKFTQSTAAGSHGWTDYGKDSYCAISYNHLPQGDKPVLLGWMSNWDYAAKLPTSPWRGQMTLPRKVTFLEDKHGLALEESPIVAPLHEGAAKPLSKTLGTGKASDSLATSTSPAELMLKFEPGDTQQFGVRLYSDAEHWTEIGFDRAKAVLYTDRTHSGAEVAQGFAGRTDAPIVEGRLFDLHIIVDRSSVEVFAQSGTIAMTNLDFPPTTSIRTEVFRSQGSTPLKVAGSVWELKSVWGTGAPPRRSTGE
jgi:sucrose-6-phosphate hydrolase SacC (GH32 family)